MGIKGTINPDHIPSNKYQLIVVGLPPILFTAISGIEEEIDVVDLPDRTRASGGNTQPVEFTAMQPMHHTVEYLVMEAWFEENKDPISITAKKLATLVHQSGRGTTIRSYTITGLWPSKRKLPDLDFENEGEMAQVEWTLQADSLLPIT